MIHRWQGKADLLGYDAHHVALLGGWWWLSELPCSKDIVSRRNQTQRIAEYFGPTKDLAVYARPSIFLSFSVEDDRRDACRVHDDQDDLV